MRLAACGATRAGKPVGAADVTTARQASREAGLPTRREKELCLGGLFSPWKVIQDRELYSLPMLKSTEGRQMGRVRDPELLSPKAVLYFP